MRPARRVVAAGNLADSAITTNVEERDCSTIFIIDEQLHVIRILLSGCIVGNDLCPVWSQAVDVAEWRKITLVIYIVELGTSPITLVK